MPQCEKCKEFFPPEYSEVIENIPNDVDKYACCFCQLDKNEVTVEIADKVYKVTKEQCIADYKALLGRIKQKKELLFGMAKGK